MLLEHVLAIEATTPAIGCRGEGTTSSPETSVEVRECVG